MTRYVPHPRDTMKPRVVAAIELRAEHGGDRTNAEIATDVGCSPSYVTRLCRDSGEQPRRPGRRPGRRNRQGQR